MSQVSPLRQRRLLLVFLATLLAAPGAAAQEHATRSLQQLQHTAWNAESGLPFLGTSQVLRTPDGYLWFNSGATLVRFDGIRFTVLDGSRIPALRGEQAGELRLLLVDHEGVLWLRSADNALVSYRAGVFTVVRPPDLQLALLGRMLEARAGGIWVISGLERRLRRLQAGEFVPAGLPLELPDTGVMGIVPDTGDGYWVGTRGQGLWHVTGSRAVRQAQRFRDPIVRPLLTTRDGTLLVAGDGLNLLRAGAWSTLEVQGRPLRPTVAVEAPDGAVWIGTRGAGVLRWRSDRLEQFTERDGLTDAVVHDLLLDPQGVAWIVTDGGLDRLRASPFVTIDRRLGLPFDSPLAIHEADDGSIWAMAYGSSGIFRLDGGIIRRQPGPIRVVDRRLTGTAGYIPFIATRDGLWLSRGDDPRLMLYHDGRLSYPGGAALPPQRRPTPRAAVQGRTTWMGLYPRGLVRIDDHQLRPVQLPGLGDPEIFTLMVDHRERLWITTEHPPGLFELTGDSVLRRPLPSTITALGELVTEGGDTLWGAGSEGQLFRMVGGKGTALHIPEVSGFLAAGSRALLITPGFLWLASDRGVARAPLRELHRLADGEPVTIPLRVFNGLDGLRVGKLTVLNQSPAFAAHDGRLWFSTPAGLAVVDPAAFVANPRPPVAQIEELTVNGVTVTRTDTITLPPSPSRLEFRYTATGLEIPERAVLEYRLDGADRDWVRSGPERVASYAQLSPGPYRFRVRAWNEDGVPSAEEAALAFRIRPTWFETWWFRALLIALVAAAGAGTLQAVQRARARVENDKLLARFEATLVERTRLARELHDTLLQGFTGITLQLQVVQRSLVDAPRDAAVALTRVLTTADATLREARQMVWDMRAPELDHHDLGEALETVARQALIDSTIALEFEVQGTPRRLDIGIETTALRIGREAVINAVKHANPTVIAVTLTFADRSLGLIVRDNGRGCDEAEVAAAVSGGHWGIRGMQERAGRAGGQLEISGGPGWGTTLTLTLPLRGAQAPSSYLERHMD